MNTSEFTYLLQHPSQVTTTQTEALKGIINTFPYFQSARALYLKGLKNAESFKYNHVLKTTAAYTTDRSILFDFITSEAFEQNKVSEFIKQHKLDISDVFITTSATAKGLDFTDDDFQQEITNTTQTLDSDFFQPKAANQEEINTEAINNKDTSETAAKSEKTTKALSTNASDIGDISTKKTNSNLPEKTLNLGEPLQFNKNETHSFNEWLSLSKFNPIQRENSEIPIEEKLEKAEEKPIELTKTQENLDAIDKAKKFDLIEQFIAKKPKLKVPTSGSSHHNIAQAQMIQPEALMTETLARIYVEQSNYKKAIQSYKILILKYPEKSGFFADQIKAVKQLQEQNNKQ